jgi:AbrB family looped-hinge helix DNA binding protein
MTTYTVTITSKNQITLPAKLVRQMGLIKGSRLTLKKRDNSITVKPEPSLEELMAPYWEYAAKHIKRPITEDDIQDEVRKAYQAKYRLSQKI